MKLEKWMEDAAREMRQSLCGAPSTAGERDLARREIRYMTATIARHFAARERDVQELVKWAQAACIVVVGLHLGTTWEIAPPIRKELARLADTSVAALAPFTAPAASQGEEHE